MLGLRLVRPLEDDWRDTLDAVARARRWPTTRDVAALGAAVASLSSRYNDAGRARASVREAGAARLGFSFARDVPKAAAAVRELVETGALRLSGRTLRVLDLGAGLGAATWGLVRALEAAGDHGTVEATWWDADAEALGVAREIVRLRGEQGAVSLRLSGDSAARSVAGLPTGRPTAHDLVLASHLLSELDISAAPAVRVERHAALLASWTADASGPARTVVVVEPALRDRTRHLHAVRDALVARGATVFAPCLHAAACPALARESDWCHEDLRVDLPPWLVPVARAAGLRFQGLTFSYLVLRSDALRLADVAESVAPTTRASTADVPTRASTARLRVVSEPMRSKGKRDAFLCGLFGPPEPSAPPPAARCLTTRLDRDASPANCAWDDLERGDVLCVHPAPDASRPRVHRDTEVSRLGPGESR